LHIAHLRTWFWSFRVLEPASVACLKFVEVIEECGYGVDGKFEKRQIFFVMEDDGVVIFSRIPSSRTSICAIAVCEM